MVAAGLAVTFNSLFDDMPAIKKSADEHLSILQSFAQTARFPWEQYCTVIGCGLLLYVAYKHVNLKQFWQSGGVSQ